MKVNNITLVIVDPCYIVNSQDATCYLRENTVNNWNCMCYKLPEKEALKKIIEWNKFYFDFSRKINFGCNSREEREAAYRELDKNREGFTSEYCYGTFCADSGEIAIYDFNTLCRNDREWITNNRRWACIIPNYTGEFNYVIKNDKSIHIIGDNFYTTQSNF